MPSLYRPTVHQIQVIPETGENAVARVEAALDHLARWIPTEEVAHLRNQLAAACIQEQPARDARIALVRSRALYPVPDHFPLRVAFFAYREGVSLILHFIWHWDGDGDEGTFAILRDFLWRPPPDLAEHAGEGLLLTAALKEEVDDRAIVAEALLSTLGQRPTALALLTLRGATLHVPRRRPLTPATYPAILLFDNPEIEEASASDRFATVVWPLVVLYTLRVEQVYLRVYRNHIDTRLREEGEVLCRRLEELFGRESGRFFSPRPAQAALTSLIAAQHRLYQTLAEAEAQLRDVQRDLANLTDILAETLTTGKEPLTAYSPEVMVRLVSAPVRRMVNQMEADVAQARVWAEQAAHGVDALRIQADLLETNYEWVLNWVIGLVGTAIAMAQLVDSAAAKVLRAWLNAGLAWLHISHRIPEDHAGVLVVRVFVMLLAMLIVAVLLKITFTMSGLRYRKPPGGEDRSDRTKAARQG